MKKNIIAGCLITLGIVAFSSSANAQSLPCGNSRIDTNALNMASQFRLSRASPLAVNYLVRVFFHIVRNDDTTNAPINPAQIKTEFATLLPSYNANNVCFLNAGFDYVNNTFLNNFFNADNDPTGFFFNPYQVPGCINIFFMQKIGGNNAACNPPCGYGGIALGGIPGTFFLVGKGNIGDGATVSHEMGHCLGLLHTFENAFGLENINGSNSSTTGDRNADTPADPYAYNGMPCYIFSGCNYTGTCTDPNGANNFTPPYTNLMGYWSGTCYPNKVFTNGQFAIINSILGTNVPIINCLSASTITQIPITISSGFYVNSAINTFNTSGSVIFNGSAKVAIGGGTVFLNPGFRANPSTGQVTISAKPCN
ncbi:MAG: hypothetical protein ACKVOW_17220 [Chitinophagaceae bacterium]